LGQETPAGCREHVERDERGRRLARELLDSRRGGVEAHLQRVEVETGTPRDHDLAVEHAAGREALDEQRMQLREVATDRFRVPALTEDVVAAAEDERAKAVPFRRVPEVACP